MEDNEKSLLSMSPKRLVLIFLTSMALLALECSRDNSFVKPILNKFLPNEENKTEQKTIENNATETKKYTISGKLQHKGKDLINYELQINGVVSTQRTDNQGNFTVYDVTIDETDLEFKIRKNEKEEWKGFKVSKGQFDIENGLMKVKKGILEVPIALSVSQNPPVRNNPSKQTTVQVKENNGVINTGDNTTINYNTSFTSN